MYHKKDKKNCGETTIYDRYNVELMSWDWESRKAEISEYQEPSFSTCEEGSQGGDFLNVCCLSTVLNYSR